MSRIPQSRDDLVAHLAEQVSFLRSSATAYDAGHFGEAKRLAVVLRILLHDTPRSTALLHALGIKASLRYYDRYADGLSPNAKGYVGVAMGFTPKGLRYFASLTEPSKMSDFNVYWAGVAIKLGQSEYKRSDVILGVSNMDGGAHVDPALDPKYAELSRDYAATWTVGVGENVGTVENGPHLPIVRQCAYEVELTLSRQAPTLLGVPSL